MIRLLILTVAALACLATSPARRLRRFPEWHVTTNSTTTVGCALLESWVSRTVKTGVGLSLELTGTHGACELSLLHAALHGVGRPVEGSPFAPIIVREGERSQTYLPFVFDANAAWNAGVREVELELVLAVDGRPQPPLRLHLQIHWPSPHLTWDETHQVPR
jgi:hypothetical protein